MRKKMACAFAVVSACAIDQAHAQSFITLYGVVNNGIEYQNAGNGPAWRAVYRADSLQPFMVFEGT